MGARPRDPHCHGCFCVHLRMPFPHLRSALLPSRQRVLHRARQNAVEAPGMHSRHYVAMPVHVGQKCPKVPIGEPGLPASRRGDCRVLSGPRHIPFCTFSSFGRSRVSPATRACLNLRSRSAVAGLERGGCKTHACEASNSRVPKCACNSAQDLAGAYASRSQVTQQGIARHRPLEHAGRCSGWACG